MSNKPARTAPIAEISDYFLATVIAAHPEWDDECQLEAAERLTFAWVR